MSYISQNHSKYLLMVHLIFSCKYRKKLLIRFGEQIKEIFYDISEEKDLNININKSKNNKGNIYYVSVNS
jgi:putative transposase